MSWSPSIYPNRTHGLPERLTRLTQLLARLPGVGEKTAQRFALHFLTTDESFARDLGQELVELRSNLRPCSRCNNIADTNSETEATCAICRDPRRNPSLLCIVAKIQDLLAIERSGAMRGRYFVLGKLLSPLSGVEASDLPLGKLRSILTHHEQPITEVLIATPPSVDGEATALLLAKEIRSLEIQVTRIASGIPHGGDLEFADQVTLGRAIEGRKQLG